MNDFQKTLLEVAQEIEAEKPDPDSKAARFAAQLRRQAEGRNPEKPYMTVGVSLINGKKGPTAPGR